MTTTTGYTVDTRDTHTKKMELVERLIKEEKLTLAEGLLLLEKEIEYIHAPAAPYQPQPWQPFYTTCTNTPDNQTTSISKASHPYTTLTHN